MNALESQLDYPLADLLPAAGQVHALAPGVLWLRMPLPFALDHINLWLLADVRDGEAGWSAVDCGVANDATRAHWEQIFDGGMEGKRLLRIFATHCHPDHVGLADWLCARFDAPLWMSTGEYAFARLMAAGLPGVDGSSALGHFQRHGLVDAALLATLAERRNYYPSLVPAVPAAYTRLRDGELVTVGARRWEVIAGFGHSPEHAALYCDDGHLLIAGDMVLPRISTNVSVFAIEPEGNPLQAYLDSLDRYEALPADTLVLPSHGKPFRGLHIRIAQLRAHHAERLAEVLEACATPQSAMDIVPRMFTRPLDTHQLTFALGEALAHLHLLWRKRVVRRRVDNHGTIRFEAI